MQLKGILPALVTPFDDKGDTDFKTLGKLLEHLLAKGVHGFVPMGSTGEYYAMSTEERNDVLKFVKETVGDRGLLIAGTNAGSTREVIRHTETAKKLGYEAVLLPPPFYSLPTQDELLAHYQAVLDAVDVEIVLYNFPLRAGVEVGFEVLDALADNPRVIGIKESSGNLLRALEINRRYGSKYQLSCGSDDQAFDFFLWGATSWICGPANCLVEPVVKFYDAFTAGDLKTAQALAAAFYPLMTNLESGKFVQKVKYGCELMGIPVGETRRPLLPLSAAEKAAFGAVFAAANAA
ncbi:4-hydroxy-tetrahydrodipicolinate synthase [Benzoatithermus flavus]|uniref:4-hydroxy-tetrahydrodipicolinate synthase n=1 Tax=Benzoatithermus flavus TaxID=3108223 RepID=A0ABU8XY49_9PROT